MLDRLIVLVEEPSMEAALEQLLPGMLGGAEFEIIRFRCKDDLLKQAPKRLKGFAAYLPENWRILVLVDRDDDDCHELKARLEAMAASAGLLSRSRCGPGQPFQVANRIAIEELEAWFFGDWEAVCAAYPRVSASQCQKVGFRDPDAIKGGTWEAMERVMQGAGYFGGGLPKIELARSVAAHMVVERNRSASFRAFADAVAAARDS
jgi:hypothetical protein